MTAGQTPRTPARPRPLLPTGDGRPRVAGLLLRIVVVVVVEAKGLLLPAASRGEPGLLVDVVVEVDPERERRCVGGRVPSRLLAPLGPDRGGGLIVIQIEAQREGGRREVHPGGGGGGGGS
jgi:hypothetical protein